MTITISQQGDTALTVTVGGRTVVVQKQDIQAPADIANAVVVILRYLAVTRGFTTLQQAVDFLTANGGLNL
jgi:hypothetical protein